MQQQAIALVRQWAAKLSHPSVERLVQDDHIIQQDGELIASGSLLSGPALHEHWPPRGDR